VKYKNLPTDGTFHRALADSQMTAHLWLEMIAEIKINHSFKQVPFAIMQRISRTAKSSVYNFLANEAKNQ
jgi:DNA polymerase-3 subunit epsilon